MSQTYTAKSEIDINASAQRVWEALTNPEMVKQYLFGTDMSADWKVGGKIFYRGVWEGKSYEDKGEILNLEPEKLLVTSYYSAFLGLEDKPENYQKVTYLLTANGDKTTLTITQENIKTPESAAHSEKNWSMVLDSLKKILEK